MSISLLNLITPAAEHAKTVPDVVLSETAEQSTYFLARIVMDVVHWILNLFGLAQDHTLFIWIYAAVVFAISYGIGVLITWIVLLICDIAGHHIKSSIYKKLTDAHFFSRTCRIIPAIVFLIFIQYTMTTYSSLSAWLTRITWIYLLFIVSYSLAIIVNVAWHHIDERENKKRLPLNGIVQIIKGAIWIIFAIVAIGILVDKSPASLLAGLGAFAAVLMLVFKDSILGVVAGVQLSENDSLHVGDWIKVDGTNANGVVTEVSLTSVKIQNWDKTTTTVPPYTLVSGSFTNYRTMQVSHTRRIQRSYLIDADSIIQTDDAMLADFARIPLLKDWIAKKIQQRAEGRVQDANNDEGLVNGSIETNLGVFRAYLQLYLNANSNFDKSSDCFISTLEQTPTGIPLQVYCFTTTSSWIPYEAIQSALFEHIAVMLYRFKLYLYESESGRDAILEGIVGTRTNGVYGLPYPFYTDSGTPSNPGGTGTAAPHVSGATPSGSPQGIKTPGGAAGSQGAHASGA